MALYGEWSQCQKRKLYDQYLGGIRFVDIRCRHFGDALPIHHGVVFQKAFFTGDVVTPTARFLTEHPSETIIMLIKFENHDPKEDKLKFHELVRNGLNNGAPGQWLEDFPATLGGGRGKIIVMHQDWPTSEPTFGRSLNDVELENSWQEHRVQAKWEKVKSGLQKALSGNPADLFVTYSSGFTEFLNVIPIPNIGAMSSAINPKLKAFLEGSDTGRHGIIVMDFPFELDNLIRAVLG